MLLPLKYLYVCVSVESPPGSRYLMFHMNKFSAFPYLTPSWSIGPEYQNGHNFGSNKVSRRKAIGHWNWLRFTAKWDTGITSILWAEFFLSLFNRFSAWVQIRFLSSSWVDLYMWFDPLGLLYQRVFFSSKHVAFPVHLVYAKIKNKSHNYHHHHPRFGGKSLSAVRKSANFRIRFFC